MTPEAQAELEELRVTVDAISRRMDKLEAAQKELDDVGAYVNSHEDRLDDHRRRIEDIDKTLNEISTSVGGLTSQVARCTKAATSASLGIDGMRLEFERVEGERHVRDEQLQATLSQLVGGVKQLLAPTLVTKSPIITAAPAEEKTP